MLGINLYAVGCPFATFFAPDAFSILHEDPGGGCGRFAPSSLLSGVETFRIALP